MEHSVSLGTDPPLETTTQRFLVSPRALKILTSPPGRQKSPDNSNTLNIFNNNTYILISEQPPNTC